MGTKKLTPEEIAKLPLTPADRMRLAVHYGHHEGDALATAMAAPWGATPQAPAGSTLANATSQFAAVSSKAKREKPLTVEDMRAAAAVPEWTGKPLTEDDTRLMAVPGWEPKPLTHDEMAMAEIKRPVWGPKPLTQNEASMSAALTGASNQFASGVGPQSVEDLGGDDRAATASEKAKDAAKAKAMGYSSPYAPAATPGNPYSDDPTEKMKAEFYQVAGMGKLKK